MSSEKMELFQTKFFTRVCSVCNQRKQLKDFSTYDKDICRHCYGQSALSWYLQREPPEAKPARWGIKLSFNQKLYLALAVFFIGYIVLTLYWVVFLGW